MLREPISDLSKMVEPDRVRKEVYADAGIFEEEMARIHESVWIYVGHDSQVPKAGDYYTAQVGRQPMILVRGANGKVNVLYNRCPHRGNMICGDVNGNTGDFFRCSYHAWTFHHDGKLKTIPMKDAYAGTRYGKDNPDCSVKKAARVENYRGFVFASLAKDGPSLKEFLGKSIVAFDDMCDRAPEGEVEVVPNCFRVIQHSNWKLFLENQLDALHPSVVHQSTGRAAHEVEKILAKKAKRAARTDLPAFSCLLKPGQFPRHADQCRRPGELLEMPPGARLGRRRLGQPRPPPRPRHREGGRGLLRPEDGHLGSADEEPDEGLGAIHGASVNLQHDVEQFLYRQSELLDTRQWQAWIDLFAPDRIYWMPPDASYKTWDGQPAIFAEDKNLMTVRKLRVLHPDAWAQPPLL